MSDESSRGPWTLSFLNDDIPGSPNVHTTDGDVLICH
jgi:hypothetical protein